ncbi:hypothetical protein [Candidatus Palauibacter sp.]|uniref:hypothetical protein n=1 Tax=Candidatus Palauibacter sp. TaxID=3101350 RepID=UPI003B52BB4B
MNRSTPFILLTAAVAALAWPDSLAGQRGNFESGVLLSPRVPCRQAPSEEAGVASVLRLTGNAYREPVAVRASAVDAAGATWISVRQSPPLREEWCWVPETHVGPTQDPSTLLVMADRLLSAPRGLPLTDWVAVHNYFRHQMYRKEVDASALLSLRRLEVLMRALDAAQADLLRDPDPRVVAWLESLGADVEVSRDRLGRHRLAVSRSALDALLDAHRDDPAAEEILWKNARYSHQPGECARSLSCVFDGPISDVAGYWLAYPDGRFVGEAIQTALTWLRRAGNAGRFRGSGGGILGTCEEARDAEPGAMYQLSRDWWDQLAWGTEGKPAARRLLETLHEVGEEEKAPLVDYLNRVERCALEVASRPRPERPPRSRGAVGTVQEAKPSQEPRELAIIAPGVSCRAEPSRTARGYSFLQLDEHFTTERPDTVVAGEAWVSVSRLGDCWVPRAETADMHDHVLAIADHFLRSGGGRTRDDALRVYNILGSRVLGYRDVVDASGLLSLRRLQVLGRVLRTSNFFSADALVRGWVEQLADDVRYFEPGARWYVRDEAFQRVYDAHRDGPEGEEILWELATGPAPHDCEGEFACTARVEVLEKFARYWIDYPRGRYVGQAIDVAAARLGGFLRTCDAARGAEPDSREAQWWEWTYWDPSGAEMAADIRATLAEVPPSDAEPLTTVLDRLEACAADVG